MPCLKDLDCQNAETQQGLHSWGRRRGKSCYWAPGSGVHTLLCKRGTVSVSGLLEQAGESQFFSHLGL